VALRWETSKSNELFSSDKTKTFPDKIHLTFRRMSGFMSVHVDGWMDGWMDQSIN